MPDADRAIDSILLEEAHRAAGRPRIFSASRLYFFRALELTPGMTDGFGRGDVERVEATWEMFDGDWTSCAYVIALRDGRRVCLQYDFGEHVREDDSTELVEQVEVLPVAVERYPELQGGDTKWNTDVQHLNDDLAL